VAAFAALFGKSYRDTSLASETHEPPEEFVAVHRAQV
jgi:hypothetical protein